VLEHSVALPSWSAAARVRDGAGGNTHDMEGHSCNRRWGTASQNIDASRDAAQEWTLKWRASGATFEIVPAAARTFREVVGPLSTEVSSGSFTSFPECPNFFCLGVGALADSTPLGAKIGEQHSAGALILPPPMGDRMSKPRRRWPGQAGFLLNWSLVPLWRHRPKNFASSSFGADNYPNPGHHEA
jgi:hypothetical protein